MFKNIMLETDGPITSLTINRPDKRNSINNATVEEIDQVLSQVERDPGLQLRIKRKGITLKRYGKMFSATTYSVFPFPIYSVFH